MVQQKLQPKEASAYNEKIQGHVDSLNKLIKVVAKGGIQIVVSIQDDNNIVAEHKVPEIKIDALLRL